jgi:hypothetical protein
MIMLIVSFQSREKQTFLSLGLLFETPPYDPILANLCAIMRRNGSSSSICNKVHRKETESYAHTHCPSSAYIFETPTQHTPAIEILRFLFFWQQRNKPVNFRSVFSFFGTIRSMPINLISNEEGREKEQRSSIPDLFECFIEDARTARSSELFRVHFCGPYTSTLHMPLLCSNFGFWSREAHNMLSLSVSFGPKPATSRFTWCLSLGAK